MSEYRGPDSISWATFPGRGRSYRMTVEGHDVEVSVSEKAKRVRVFVDGKELR
jgi:hypothetical protein